MVKKLLISILLINIYFITFSENVYSPNIIKIIPCSEKEGELGYNQKDIIPGAGKPRPLDYVISNEGLVYTYDWANNRIVQYDLNLNYIKTIKCEKIYFGYMASMKIDNFENIYTIKRDNLYRYNKNCKEDLLLTANQFSITALSDNNYYPSNGFVFYYNDDFTLECIDKEGKKLPKENTKDLLNEINTKKRSKANVDDILSYNIIDSFIKETKTLLFKGKRLYINNRDEYLKYIKFVQDKVKKDKKLTIDNGKNITSNFYVMVELLGYDNSDNAYWQSNNSILIFSPLGEIVENVEYDAMKYLDPKVAPNGDIYFWDVKPEGVTFYKITRQW